MKSLVIYFSHAKENYVNGKIRELEIGNTKIVAQKINGIINGDIVEIRALKEYPYNYHACTIVAKDELEQKIHPKIKDLDIDIDLYDDIYLGYPNWWGTMPMCVVTFLENYDLVDKEIHPFCTHEGSFMGNSEKDIKRLCPHSKVRKGLSIKGSQVSSSECLIRKWLGGL